MEIAVPYISKDIFVEILQDNQLVRKEDLLIFQTIYSLKSQEASATDLSRIIGWKDSSSVVGRVVGMGKRILKKYRVKQSEREDGSKRLWDLFFTGYYKGRYFIYILKPELKEALEECSLVGGLIPTTTRNAYLFVWNPAKWEWADLDNNIEELKTSGRVTLKWSCRSHKSIQIGDRAFIARVGSSPKGIMGSGRVVSEPFLSKHWSGEDKDVPRVLIEFDVLLNPQLDPILTLDLLDTGNLGRQMWTPQSSGISIKPEVVGELEREWFEFLRSQNFRFNPLLEVADDSKTFVEGSTSQVLQTRYERNIYARDACLRHHGYTCKVCELNFEETYGSIGYKFIHVHHLTPVSTIGKEYVVNPVDDLRPVCPNCHAMLHRQSPPLTIEELKQIMKGEVNDF